jgi:hypothetical protein
MSIPYGFDSKSVPTKFGGMGYYTTQGMLWTEDALDDTKETFVFMQELFKSLIVTTAAGLAEFGQDYCQSGFSSFCNC